MSEPFALATDGIDPVEIVQRTLFTGARMPCIGLGTFGSDHQAHEQVAQAVRSALSVGYRHIDCASVYGNEKAIGQVFREVFASGLIRRQDLWITSKLWNDRHGEGQVFPACEQSLRDLQCEYLDLYLVHWPFPNYHPPGCSVEYHSPDAKPYIHDDYMKTWRQMEELVDVGLVRHIGVSNMTIPKLERLLRDCRIKPACAELEVHPHFQQPELLAYVKAAGMVPIGYCPLGSPNRPARDRTADDTVDMEDPVVVEIAGRLDVHPSLVCLAWAVQNGVSPIPFSVKRRNYLSNLSAGRGTLLSSTDLKLLSGIDKNNRLIKGQVFCWKENQDWRDLWDEKGYITPA